MVNATEFSARLKLLLEHLGMASSAFAQSIDVNRSSISHLLSGRNKPSLDVIIKILEKYPEVNLYWLLNGKGEFLSKSPEAIPPVGESKEATDAIAQITSSEHMNQSHVERIVIFYKDGSFKSYQNS
ncbi:MAG: helix-turn-helix transcriptional regulator [Gilvibacter sp.]